MRKTMTVEEHTERKLMAEATLSLAISNTGDYDGNAIDIM